MRVHHIALSVSDLDRSLNFYKYLFGFEEVSEFDRPDLQAKAKFIKLGEFQIELWKFKDYIPAKDDASKLSILGIRHLAFQVDDIEKEYQNLISKNIEVSKLKQGKTGKYCFIKDPDGIKLEFYQPDKNN